MSNILKRPDVSLPKPYKEAQKKVNSWWSELQQKKDDDPFEIYTYEVPYLFLLTEEHINLPDMTLEELKMVFPYYFDSFVYPYSSGRRTVTVGKIRKIMELSQRKRIPLTLGKLFEEQRFAKGSKSEKLKYTLEELMNQEDSCVIDGYLPLILEVGVLPGLDLEQENIRDWNQLIALWKQFDDVSLEFWQYRSSYSEIMKSFQVYESEFVEIDWTIMEFLQTYSLEWEDRQIMTKREEQAMDILSSFVKIRQWTREDVDKLSLLFEGDAEKTREFLEKNKNGRDNIIFDKPTLCKVLKLAQCGRSEFNREENGYFLTRFLKMKESKKHTQQKSFGGGFIYKVNIQDVEIRMELEVAPKPVYGGSDVEKFCLKELSIEHMTDPVEIIICERDKEYHPIFSYGNIWRPDNFQNYSKMIIKGEMEIEVPIPYISSVSPAAFSKIPLKTLEVRGMVEKIECHSETVEEIKIISDIEIGYQGFCNCKNLKKVVIPSLDRNANTWKIPDIFRGCNSLVSMIGKDNQDLLEIPLDWYYWEIEDLFEGEEADRSKMIVQKDFLWWPKIIDSGAEILIYDAGDTGMGELEFYNEDWAFDQYDIYSCENIKEIRFVEGLQVLGREFSKCHNLRKITLPSSLKCLSYKAFKECSFLGSIELPLCTCIERDEILKEGEPFDTSIFKKIILPENHYYYKRKDSILYAETMWGREKQIDVCWTADDMEGKVIIPEGVNRIRDLAFQDCKNITEIVLPASLNIIEKGAFTGCTSLKKVVIQNRRLQIYDKDAYYNSEYYEEDEYSFRHSWFRLASNLIFGPEVELQYTDLPKGTLHIPEGTIYIPKYEYMDCKDITEVILPRSLTSIGEYAFKGCTEIKRVVVSGKEPWRYPEEVFGSKVPKIEFRNKEKSNSLTYRPFADIYDLIHEEEE